MIELKIEGMTCPHCVAAVHEALAQVPGVTRVVDVDLTTGRAAVEGDVALSDLTAAVEAAGYRVAGE
ncbi:CopZ family metallochaperone [Thiococcus pfennigii]|jgi:copper chaperone CopZ|uniref:CopZ family metallochaperone n=1 Tax=Thiococcus pfennigii TaxID=1057 RepID=UPI0019083AFB|nr:cation transporter [Thiococcus pfennigii]MBK1702579.1 heavy metal-binding protein [Thiococcus pfennigii]MBK1732822.1 heavy metal-binding protein [Thiococcus pfennigii]